MKLGPFEIEHPFILAPMAGITNSPFRRLMKRKRSALVVSELISANGLQYNSRKTQELMKFKEDERIVGLQIFGERPDLLNLACQHVEKLGADFVDLNLGCPVQKIVKKGAGSAMCRDPKLLSEVLKGMVASVKIPVTIKIRTGWDADHINLHEIVKVATDAGVSWVAIHGRTRAQAYSGEADWDLIGEAKHRASIPIIGNGDLQTPQMAVKRFKESGVDAVMIGRGALRNPFIFEQAESVLKTGEAPRIELDDYLEILSSLRELLEDHFDERMSLVHSRKFLSWYSSGFRNCHEFRREVFSQEDRDTLWKNAISFFKAGCDTRDLSFLSQPFLMGGHG